MHITEIYAEALPPDAWFKIACDERVNVFVGPNASGKSRILRAMKALHSLALRGSLPEHTSCETGTIRSSRGSIGFFESSGEGNLEDDTTFEMEASDDWTRDPPDSGFVCWNVVPFLFIPASRIGLASPHVFGFSQTINKPEDVDADDALEQLFDTEGGVFNGRHVELAFASLRRESDLTHRQAIQVKRAVSIGHACARKICSEVIYDNAPHDFVENEFDLDTGLIVHHGMGIGTSDIPLGGPLYAGDLSSGTQGTLLWVWALALKIASHYDWTPGWEAKSAVLLIDEIENHLHPTWQRRVIPALLEHFPGLQIFAATHSPFVVAGRKAGQVHLLQRSEEGGVSATTNTEDVIGWTVDEILRTMMGVDDPTDQETASAAQELRKLRAQGPITDPHEEEQRQQRMQELRQLVDRDLLAGGPMAAQRELFEHHFAEALEKRRRSQDLSQENG